MSHPERLLMERLNAVGEGAPSLEEKCGIAAMLRSLPEGSQRLDRMLIGERDRFRIGLQEAQGNQREDEGVARQDDCPAVAHRHLSLPRQG